MQEFIKQCMEEIENSISLSMDGTSYQPQSQKTPVPPPNSTPKMKIPACGGGDVGAVATSTTPTDLMEVTAAYVY